MQQASSVKLGEGWDVDFLTLEVIPQCIPIFSPWWNVGGKAYRLPRDPFPSGLELVANDPFTLRVQLPGSPSDAQVAAWGKLLLELLKLNSPTFNPTLIAPPNTETLNPIPKNLTLTLKP